MSLKNKIKNTIKGLTIVAILALPQGLDYIANGPYKVTQIGNDHTRKIIHEYNHKIEVTGFLHPFGTIMIDNGKDGILDEVRLHPSNMGVVQ